MTLAQQEARLFRRCQKLYDKKCEKILKELRKAPESTALKKPPTARERKRYERKMNRFILKNPGFARYLSFTGRLTRWKIIEYILKSEMLDIAVSEEAEITKHLTALAKKHGDNLTDKEIKRMLKRRWAGRKNYTARLSANNKKLARTLLKEIKTGVNRGDDMEKLSRTVRERLDKGARQTKRLAYTEGSYIINEASAMKMEKKHDYYRIVGVLDSKTCDECAALNGRIFPFRGREPGLNFPPFHPSCRCRIKPIDEA